MELRRDGWYQADKGKHFVLTEKGKIESASYINKVVGQPVDEYDTEAPETKIRNGFLEEVDIPDWVVTQGYRVVYDYKGNTIPAGSGNLIFHDLDIARKYRDNYNNKGYKEMAYITDAVFEGREPKACDEYNGKLVYNDSWYYGPDALAVGDYVEESIIDDMVNALPPACMRADCIQCGEAYSTRLHPDGGYRNTYTTFKQVDEGVYEYCGDCFRGENSKRKELEINKHKHRICDDMER